MQCPVCQRGFSRRDNMLRDHRNVHGGGSRRGGGGESGEGGGGESRRGGESGEGGGGESRRGGESGGGEAEVEKEAEEEVRESLSIGNPFSFVIRSRQTLLDRRLWKDVFR